MKIGIVAGEKSGDYLGSELIKAIRQRLPEAEFTGLCGPLMQQQGATTLAEMDKISIMGFEGLLGSVREILAIRNKLFQHFINDPPEVFIGIDVPDFNLTLERKLKSQGIPTVHMVSPTVWAWRGGRIKKIRKSVDLMLTLFPFEEKYYQKQQVPVKYIAHPLASEVENHSPSEKFKGCYSSSEQKLIAVLPGSRMAEVSRLATIMNEAAILLNSNHSNLKFVIPAANKKISDYLQANLASVDCVEIIEGQSLELLANCDLAVVASGTAALETALFAKPMVVMYKTSRVSEVLFRMTGTVEHFSMPNHLIDPPIVPELIQDNATVGNLVAEVDKLLTDQGYYQTMHLALKPIQEDLLGDSGSLACNAIFDLLEKG